MTFFRSYSPNYFSIQDIMATQERTPCKILRTILRLGFLCPENDKEDIVDGTEVEWPFWLAQKLKDPKHNIAKLDIPKVYKEKTREIFEADPKVINLYKVNPHFYEFGSCLSRLNHIECEMIQTVIVKTFKERFRLIMDWVDNLMVEPTKVQQLDVTERILLKTGQKSRMQLDSWLIEGVSQMKAAEMVVNFKKRKLLALENE